MKPKLSKKQKAILEKYSDIVEALETSDVIGQRAYNKATENIYKINKQIRKIKVNVDQLESDIFNLNIEGVSAKDKVRDLEVLKNKLKNEKSLLFDLQFQKRSAGGFIYKDGQKISVNDENVTDEESKEITKKIEEVKRKLDNYEAGDMTRTTFYHQYGFTQITDEALRFFVKGEYGI